MVVYAFGSAAASGACAAAGCEGALSLGFGVALVGCDAEFFKLIEPTSSESPEVDLAVCESSRSAAVVRSQLD